MGRGNCCVFGECEGLYYVDYEFLDVYSKQDEDGEWISFTPSEAFEEGGCEFDHIYSLIQREDFEREFVSAMMKRFKSFRKVDKWVSGEIRAILENDLFYVALEDNQWSVAVELLQKETEYGTGELIGLQAGLYQHYLNGIKEILLDMFGEVGTYSGPWTSGVIRKEREAV